MKFEDLSPEDQALVKTDFGSLDKVAEGIVKEASEAYEYGAEKYALEIADGLDKVAAEEAEEKVAAESTLTEEQEKSAAELGAFVERGVYDGLAKLGQERHGDPMHYFIPFIEEKIAETGAKAALIKGWDKMKGHAGSVGARGKAMLAGATSKVKEHKGKAAFGGGAATGFLAAKATEKKK